VPNTSPFVAVASEDSPALDLDLTVLLAVRDGAQEVPDLLESLADQDFAGTWEVVVADNGSRDGTADVVRRWADRLPGFRLLSVPPPARKAGALNVALRQVRGRSVITVDADDVLDRGYLSAMAVALERFDVVGGFLDVAALNPPHLQRRRRAMQQQRLDTFMSFRPVVVGAAFGVRTEVLRSVGGFDPDLRRLSDMDVSFRLALAGATMGFAPDAVVHYRYRDGLRAIYRQEKAYGEGEVTLYVKHRADGLRRRRARRMLADWARILLALRGGGTLSGRAEFVTRLGAAVGRARGSLRHRVLYL
jgi:glycosyltransferase involved in cell wall biosynthesis